MAEWVVVENNEITEYYDNVPKNWRNISGLVLSKDDAAFMQSAGWYPVEKVSVEYNRNTQHITGYTYEIDQNSVREIPVIESLPEVSIDQKRYNFLSQLRSKRDQLLKDCDWTQTADVQATMTSVVKQKWTTYRAALRDLPGVYSSTEEFDFSKIVWPTINVN
jgi:hypothetical protein